LTSSNSFVELMNERIGMMYQNFEWDFGEK